MPGKLGFTEELHPPPWERLSHPSGAGGGSRGSCSVPSRQIAAVLVSGAQPELPNCSLQAGQGCSGHCQQGRAGTTLPHPHPCREGDSLGGSAAAAAAAC